MERSRIMRRERNSAWLFFAEDLEGTSIICLEVSKRLVSSCEGAEEVLEKSMQYLSEAETQIASTRNMMAHYVTFARLADPNQAIDKLKIEQEDFCKRADKQSKYNLSEYIKGTAWGSDHFTSLHLVADCIPERASKD
jgi:hypothetical protein